MINYLELIDWRMIIHACLWINGLAIVVATFGFAQNAAQRTERRFLIVLRERGYQTGLYAGLTLLCMGLIGSSRHWWEVAAWVALGFWFCLNVLLALRASKSK